MSLRPLPSLSAASGRSALRRGQMSQPKVFGAAAFGAAAFVSARRPLRHGAGFGGRPAVDMGRDDVLRFWSGLMLRQCGSAHAVAMRFDVTEQTGRNWINGFACPTGLAVMRAQAWWPDEFCAFQLRRVA